MANYGGDNSRPGDWNCGCGGHNFASRSTCFKCGVPKAAYPQGGFQQPFQTAGYGGGGAGGGGGQGGNSRPGDWNCGCGGHNFASRSTCFKCGVPKAAPMSYPQGGYQEFQGNGGYGGAYNGGMYQGGGGAGGAGNSNMRPGDWSCPSCSAHNFASKTACFKCQVPKPENAPGMVPYGAGGAGGFRASAPAPQGNRRPGDWDCSGCAAHNFASKAACFKCGADKTLVEGAGVRSDAPPGFSY